MSPTYDMSVAWYIASVPTNDNLSITYELAVFDIYVQRYHARWNSMQAYTCAVQ